MLKVLVVVGEEVVPEVTPQGETEAMALVFVDKDAGNWFQVDFLAHILLYKINETIMRNVHL